MTDIVWLMWGTVFAAAAFVTYGLLTYYGNRRTVKARFKKSLYPSKPGMRREGSENPYKKGFLEWISSLGKFVLKDQKELSKTRNALIQAGFRNPKGPAIYFGIRALTAFSLPLPYLLVTAMKGRVEMAHLLVSILLVGVGFYLPQYILKAITRRRQKRIEMALPDILDLFIVCMEAGMSLQATVNRVTEEIRPISKDLYNEMQLTNAELRTGIKREVVLRNLGERTGVQDVKSLMALMIQSEKMGTCIAQSLRTHASFMRVQRGQKAEEIAAKLPVKIMIPMIFFIFPSILVVVLGPAIIQITKSPLFTH
ncbi:MAG: type II secretion system F family protein [Desulfobaccales bacterium]|nr:type II secretion system F family protein [Desulfobaccales bacterium]